MREEAYLQAIDEASAWLDIEGVESVGQGEEDGRPCIVVGISAPAEQLRDRLPDSFHDLPVVLRETGAIRAQ